jgi:hypothetical protein
VLEGLAAYLQAKRSHYESLQQLQTALAQILYVTGQTAPAKITPAGKSTP